MNNQQLTLLVAKRLLQHGEDDRVVQHKIAEVAGSCGAQSGIANKCVFIQQTAGGGGPAGRRESSQHLHDAGEHHRRTDKRSMTFLQPLTSTIQQVMLEESPKT